MTTLDLAVAPSFLRDYRRAGVGLQRLAEGAIHDLIRLADSNPKGWRRRYDRVEGLTSRGRVLEIDLASGPRLLAVDDGTVVLWRMGDHSIVESVVRSQPDLPSERLPLPLQFLPNQQIGLFPADADEGFIDYANERTPDWAYWLDAQQSEAAWRIMEEVETAYAEDRRAIAAVFGGPGTGKTTILIWLLKQLACLEPHAGGLNVQISAPRSVITQVENSTGWDLCGMTFNRWAALDDGDEYASPDVILLDDPSSLQEVESIVSSYPDASVVFGFDPLQMQAAPTDAELDSWMGRLDIKPQWFSSCYRQKAAVGKAAKHVADVVAASSPFLRHDKKERHRAERARLTQLANETQFPNPSGLLQTFTEPTQDDWDEYWGRLYRLRRERRLWDHWPPVLVVTDARADVPPKWMTRADSVATHRSAVTDLQAVKGLEYQHVLMLLSQGLYDSLNSGFEGSGQRAYDEYRLFRIPFSRAKDSLVTFVFPTLRDVKAE